MTDMPCNLMRAKINSVSLTKFKLNKVKLS